MIPVLKRWTAREVERGFYSISFVSKFIPLAQNPLQDNNHNNTDEGWRKYHYCNYTDEKNWGSGVWLSQSYHEGEFSASKCWAFLL